MLTTAETVPMERPAQNRFNVAEIRKNFPILNRKIGDKPLVYLDNAASSQMPQRSIDMLVHYHTHLHANVHRGVHTLSQEATAAYEGARAKVRGFIGAASDREVIFTRGTSDAINLVASSYGRTFLNAGDEVIISTLEHHSNIVPWQMICKERGAVLKVIPVNDRGELDLEGYQGLLSERTKMVAVGHVSNALGTINPVRAIIDMAHERGVPVLLDGAQAAPHLAVDVQALDCDFYAFSSHKMYGPTGIGVLYGKEAWLEKMEPYQGGGDMILTVTFDKTTYNALPYKFEAGTPMIAAAVALGESISYLNEIGMENIARHEHMLLVKATEALSAIDGVRLVGTAQHKAAVVSFVMDNVHPHDIGTILDFEGVAIRAGHHCAQPVMDRFNIPATARASFAMYNTVEEIDILVGAIHKVKEIFC